MSHKATNWAFSQRGLKPATRVVLLYLADRHNPDFGCFPSQAQLAADCDMSRRSVNHHLEELENLGLIRRVRRIDPDTRKQMSTRYILGFEPDFTQESCAKSAHGKAPEPCANFDKSRVQNLHTNPVIEPVNTTTGFGGSGEGFADRCLEACGPGLSDASRELIRSTDAVLLDWIEGGADLEADILPVLSERTASPRQRTIRTWDYFGEAVRARQARRVAQEAKARKNAEKQRVVSAAPESDPLVRLASWINSGARVPSSAVSNTQRDALIARGLVSPDRLRELQIY